MTRPVDRASRLLLVLGCVVSVAGVVVLAVDAARPVSFGWFAYAPLSDTVFTTDGLHVLSTASLVGAVVVVIGLLLVSACLGYRRGARRRP